MANIDNYNSPLPVGFSFKNELPKNAQIGLSNRKLKNELSIWLDYMWEMEQSPSQQMAYEAIYILENRMNPENSNEITSFINAINEYARETK